jgi:hypothetical protein
MSLLVLPWMRALRGVPRARLEATVDAHFSGVRGSTLPGGTHYPVGAGFT